MPFPLLKVKDSKLLGADQCRELAALIIELLPAVGVGICDHSTIDRINILEATFLAMKKALGALKRKPAHLLIDGKFTIPNLSIPQTAIIDGDALAFAIAAASIVAKETRDRLMDEAHALYPQYGFDKHKGYGTKAHMDNLMKFGPCPIHRRSFAPLKRLIVA